MISAPRLGFLKPDMQTPEWARSQYTSFDRAAAETREEATNFLYSLTSTFITLGLSDRFGLFAES